MYPASLRTGGKFSTAALPSHRKHRGGRTSRTLPCLLIVANSQTTGWLRRANQYDRPGVLPRSVRPVPPRLVQIVIARRASYVRFAACCAEKLRLSERDRCEQPPSRRLEGAFESAGSGNQGAGWAEKPQAFHTARHGRNLKTKISPRRPQSLFLCGLRALCGESFFVSGEDFGN